MLTKLCRHVQSVTRNELGFLFRKSCYKFVLFLLNKENVEKDI